MPSFLFIALLIFGTKYFGHLSSRIGMPPIVGMIVTGIILGPALLNIVHQTPLVTGFAELGVVLLLFLAGLETDINSLRENFKSSFTVAIIGVALPFIGGWAVGSIFGFETLQSMYVGTLLVATSVSISVQTLRELNRLRSKEGFTVLGAAVIDDVLGLIVLTVILTMAGTTAAASNELISLTWTIPAFFVVIFLLGRFVVPPILNYSKQLKVDAPLYAVGIGIACATAYVTKSFFDMEPIIGAYLMGLMISLTPHNIPLYGKIEEVSSMIFVPVFFGSIGLVATFAGFGPYVGLFALLFVVSLITKWVAGTWGGRLTGLSKESGRIVGASMICRGEVGLIVAAIGLSQEIISSELYTVMVLIAIATTLVTPILLKVLIPKSQNTDAII